MKFNEFLKIFYINRQSSGLIGYKSKGKISSFFLHTILGEFSDLLPTSESGYIKWYEGTRQPSSNVWAGILNSNKEYELQNKLENNLNMKEINTIAGRFNVTIPDNEIVDKEALAFAITKQFFKLAEGNGDAENIIPIMYNPSKIVFQTYAVKAYDKFSKIKIPFISEYEERLLNDVYVCNKLSSSNNSMSRATIRKQFELENPSLEIIKNTYSNKTILIGNGGMGKTMMLKYLFVKSIKNHITTGILPIFSVLREFSYEKKSIIEYLVESVTHYGEKFDEKLLIKLLEQGKCQILLDGIDEIDPSDASSFRTQLSELVDKYPNNQFLIASRECEMVKMADGFSKLYLKPFDDQRKENLIDNLLHLPEQREINKEVKCFLADKFISNHCVFASNPMLLTFVIINHPILSTFNGKQSLFYKKIYETILSGHDKEKPNYDRVFHSVQNGDEFTTIFREFCALTFIDNIHEFDIITFEKYFKKLKTKSEITNPHGITKDRFLRDACATSCMLYEETSKILYIDQGFQELFFAEYMYFSEEQDLISIRNKLFNASEEYFNGGTAFEMFNEMDNEKTEQCLFVPYLESIFSHNDENKSFLSFIEKGYKEITYNLINLDLKAEYTIKTGLQWNTNKLHIMTPANVVYSMILRKLNQGGILGFESWTNELQYTKHQISTFVATKFNDNGITKLSLQRILGDINKFEESNDLKNFLTDNKRLIRFGYEYNINLSEVTMRPDDYVEFINTLKNPSGDLWLCFLKLKELYALLSKKYKQ